MSLYIIMSEITRAHPPCGLRIRIIIMNLKK